MMSIADKFLASLQCLFLRAGGLLELFARHACYIAFDHQSLQRCQVQKCINTQTDVKNVDLAYNRSRQR